MDGWIVDLSLWRFPASLILGAAFLPAVWVLHRHYAHTRLHRLLSGPRTACVLIAVLAAAMAVEGIWAVPLHRTYPFAMLILAAAANLELAVLSRLSGRDAGFLLNHTGLLIILWGSLFGAPDTVEARTVVRYGETVRTAYTPQGDAIPLPFEIRLDRFGIDYHDDGITPAQFRSALRLDGSPVEISVNAPARRRGYTIYQDGYDTARSGYTVLLLVRDPWLWVVWLGAAMLAAGSFILLFRKR